MASRSPHALHGQACMGERVSAEIPHHGDRERKAPLGFHPKRIWHVSCSEAALHRVSKRNQQFSTAIEAWEGEHGMEQQECPLDDK